MIGALASFVTILDCLWQCLMKIGFCQISFFLGPFASVLGLSLGAVCTILKTKSLRLILPPFSTEISGKIACLLLDAWRFGA